MNIMADNNVNLTPWMGFAGMPQFMPQMYFMPPAMAMPSQEQNKTGQTTSGVFPTPGMMMQPSNLPLQFDVSSLPPAEMQLMMTQMMPYYFNMNHMGMMPAMPQASVPIITPVPQHAVPMPAVFQDDYDDIENIKGDKAPGSRAKGVWKPDEEVRFKEALEKYGEKDLDAVAEYVKTRTRKQLRWKMYWTKRQAKVKTETDKNNTLFQALSMAASDHKSTKVVPRC